MASKVKLGLVQMSMEAEIDKNIEKASDLAASARKQGAEIICLPELFTGPYFCASPDASFDYAETIPGASSKKISALAKKLGAILVAGSIHEKAADKYFNTSMLFNENGDLLGTYRKIHIPHDENFFEQTYFSPGDSGFKVFETSKGRLSVLICYDQWFPEAARASVLLGAEILFYPTAIGTVADIPQSEGNWQEAWENVMRGHAIANSVVVAAVNRTGQEGSMNFWGGSFVCDAFGKTLKRAGNRSEVIVQEIDLEHGRSIKEGWRFFYNRRPDMYSSIVK